MARSWSLAVILCVFALRMRTTSQQICSPMNSVPMVETNPPSTANVIIVRCTSVGPSNPISNPVWYLNGENMNESRCFQGSSPDNNQLTFTITPDCEGYLQCGIPPMQATCAVSRPKPVYAYPERTPGNPRTMGAVLGTDVVIPCDFVVSSLGNTEACWTFISEFTGDRRDLSCTTGPTYNLPISSVTSANAGKYFCQVTASNLPDIPRAGEPGPVITLKVVEPARAEGIKVSVNGDRYMFSVLSPSGSELKYTWFQNDTVTSSTTSSLTVPDLPRGTTRVKVSISNQIDSNVMFMDSSSTIFTDNVTIEVTHPPRISYQCASPTSLVLPSPSVPKPSTDAGTIVNVVLALLIVLTLTVIIVLVVVIYYLATELKNVRRKRDQPQQEKDQLRQDRNQQVVVLQFEKERQISQGSHFSDEPDSRMAPECTNVATLLTKITRDIAGECPQFLTPIFCLKTVRNIVECLTENVNCNTDEFKNLMRKIRRDAEDLYDIFVDKKKQKQEQSKNLGERSTEVDCDDEGGMLAEAMDQYQWCLDKLDEKLRELGVEIEDQVQEMADQVQEIADQVQETADQVQETKDQVQEMEDQVQKVVDLEDQVQKVVDLDQEGDDLR